MAPATNSSLNAPRVSVVSSFFNVEKYLVEMIDSVLTQDFRHFELLLVDDGSTDGSTQIAKDYARRNPRQVTYVEHVGHANLGTCAGRNLGARRARGELIAFVDGDDRWRQGKLREQVELLDRMPGVDAIFGSANYWGSWAGGKDEIVPTGHVRNRPVLPPEALLKVYPLGNGASPCPDMVIRRSTLDAIGGFEEAFVGRYFLYEDQAFLLKLYLHATVYFSDAVWLDYRLHDQSCTAKGEKAGLGWEARRFCLEWFEQYLARTRHRFDPRIRLALMRALRPYRHPHISAAGRRVKSLLRQADA